MKNNIPKSDIDYVVIYANKLRENNKYFKQQKELIESQLKSSISLFGKKFGTGEVFKKRAREYLKQTQNL